MSYGTHYKDIWTKDPHGGAYHRAGDTNEGYDALTQRPDRSVIQLEPGYEKPASGPTTNFVGNHMTQAAIDLVQSELQAKREQALSGQRVLHLQPAAEDLGVFYGGDAQQGAAIISTHAALCNTPAGAAAHLRNVRRAVLLARSSHKG